MSGYINLRLPSSNRRIKVISGLFANSKLSNRKAFLNLQGANHTTDRGIFRLLDISFR